MLLRFEDQTSATKFYCTVPPRTDTGKVYLLIPGSSLVIFVNRILRFTSPFPGPSSLLRTLSTQPQNPTRRISRSGTPEIHPDALETFPQQTQPLPFEGYPSPLPATSSVNGPASRSPPVPKRTYRSSDETQPCPTLPPCVVAANEMSSALPPRSKYCHCTSVPPNVKS